MTGKEYHTERDGGPLHRQEWAMGWFPWLSGNEAKVLTVLAYRANKNDGTCYPSQTGLADDCGLSRQRTNGAIQRLVNAGAVVVFENRQRQGRSSIYQLTGALNGWPEHPAELIRHDSPLESKRDKACHQSVTRVEPKRDNVTPKVTPKENTTNLINELIKKKMENPPPHPNGTSTPRERDAENGWGGMERFFQNPGYDFDEEYSEYLDRMLTPRGGLSEQDFDEQGRCLEQADSA